MAATAGQAIFQGVQTGQTFNKDLYFSDTVNTPINWDGGVGASATSPEDWRLPEAAYLVDVAITTGAAQTKLNLTRNGVPTGAILRYGVHLDTLNNRPKLAIPFNRGDVVAGLQLA